MTFEQVGVVILAVAGGLVVVSPIFLGHAFARRLTRNASAKAAAALGLSFTPKVDLGQLGDHTGILPFEQGRLRSAANLMEGSRAGRRIAMLEHCYLMGSGRNLKYVWQEIVIFPEVVAGLPDFQITARDSPPHSSLGGGPKFLLKRMRESPRLTLDGTPAQQEFTRRYVVRGDDREAIERVLTDAVMHAFGEGKVRYLEASRGRLYAWDPNWRSEFGWRSTRAYQSFLDNAARIAVALTGKQEHDEARRTTTTG